MSGTVLCHSAGCSKYSYPDKLDALASAAGRLPRAGSGHLLFEDAISVGSVLS